MRRAPTLTKRERRELEPQRPRTLTRMRVPGALPPGWIQCPKCSEALECRELVVYTFHAPGPANTAVLLERGFICSKCAHLLAAG